MIREKINILDGNLEVGKKYRIKKAGRKEKHRVDVEGKLIEKYNNYYMFNDYRGYTECFLKKDFAIGEYQIEEVR